MESRIIFDQYSRYKACADILHRVNQQGGTILDVGSGEECLLGKFLPAHDIVYVDPLLSSRVEKGTSIIAGDVFSSDLNGRSFDYVVSVDTLEHIAPDKREVFLERLNSLCTKGLIVACPCSDAGDAVETDRWLNEVHVLGHGSSFSWLEEHTRYGLPKLDAILKQFAEFGLYTSVAQNGHTPWLREFLGFVLCNLNMPELRPAIMELSEYFNRSLYQFDQTPPCYRQIVVGMKTSMRRVDQRSQDQSLILEGEARVMWEHIQKRIVAYSARAASVQAERILKQEAELRQKEAELGQQEAELGQKEAELRNVYSRIKAFRQTASWSALRIAWRFKAQFLKGRDGGKLAFLKWLVVDKMRPGGSDQRYDPFIDSTGL